MPNLRIVSDNAIARAASLVASSTAGALVVSNLANDKKSSVHRATGKSVTYTMTWPEVEQVGCVALPFCNLSPTAQWRVRVSDEEAAANMVRYSEGFENSTYWAKTAGTAPNAGASVVSPSGSTNANKLTEDNTASSVHSVAQSISGFVAGDTVTFSVFLRAAERGFASIKFDSASTAAPVTSTVIINLGTGAMTALTAGGWTYSTQNYSGGWWRVYATRTATADGLIRPNICTASSSTVSVYTGVSGSGIYLWGAMIQKGDKSSYFPNLASATSATRPAGYIDSWQSYDYNSGWVPACPWPSVRLRGFTAAQAACAYAYGGGTYARHWLPANIEARGIVVDISDPDNVPGYTEVACMVVGPVLTTRYNASATSVSVIDRTEISRGAAGDQLVDPGTISRKVPVDLRAMPEVDRARVLDLVRNSRAYPVLMSVFPEHPDLALERDFTIYGRRTKDSDIAYQFAGAYSTNLEIEEI